MFRLSKWHSGQYRLIFDPAQALKTAGRPKLYIGRPMTIRSAFASGDSIEVSSHSLSNNTDVIIQSAIAAQGIAYIPA